MLRSVARIACVVQGLGMANVLDVKPRDYGRDIAADDPLMELSRIMGFDKPQIASESEPADPQIAIEDSFSMDLERELALEEVAAEAPSELDAEFNAAFEDELSGAIQFGEDAPSVVPSLEDELNALLGEETHSATAAKAIEPAYSAPSWINSPVNVRAEPDNSWLEEDMDATAAEHPQLASNTALSNEVSSDITDDTSAQLDDAIDFEESLLKEELDLPIAEAAAPLVDAAQSAENWTVEPVDEDAELDTSWLDEKLDAAVPTVAVAAYETVRPLESWASDEQTEDSGVEAPRLEDELDIAEFEHVDERLEIPATSTDSEPWLDFKVDDDKLDDQQSDLSDEVELAEEPQTQAVPAVDLIFAQMGRATPTSYQPAVSPAEEEVALDDLDFDFAIEDSAPVSDTEYDGEQHGTSVPPAPEFDGWQPNAAASSTLDRGQSDDFGRILAETAPEPVVEASEPMQDAVALTEEFEIPDFEFSPEPQAAAPVAKAGYEPEYSGYEPKVERAAVSVSRESDFDFEALLDEQLAADNGRAASAAVTAGGIAAAATMRPKATERVDADVDFQPFGEEAPVFPDAGYQETAPRGRSWVIPAVLAGVALFGGGIYYAFSGNHVATSTSGPALVKADPQPVKIAPENPGGKSVPDQDKAVYNKVDGEQAGLPTQGTLVSESEEPVDIASVASDEPVDEPGDASAKSEARVDASAEAETAAAPTAASAAVTPKKVRTFIVKPDGTLVERPAAPAADAARSVVANEPVAAPATKLVQADPAPEPNVAEADATIKPVAVEPVAVAVAEKPSAVTPAKDPIAELAAAEPAPVAAAPEAAKAAPALKVVKTKKIKAPAAETVASTTPSDGAPVLESRPADQPVTIVGKTGGKKAAANAPAEDVQVASADVAPAATAGGYAIQIASTPSPEAAKSTYAALNRKFLSVIGGRGVNIQKADVAGKGTVYRVRIPAGSKQEAAALCSQYKASGGNCFVTK